MEPTIVHATERKLLVPSVDFRDSRCSHIPEQKREALAAPTRTVRDVREYPFGTLLVWRHYE